MLDDFGGKIWRAATIVYHHQSKEIPDFCWLPSTTGGKTNGALTSQMVRNDQLMVHVSQSNSRASIMESHGAFEIGIYKTNFDVWGGCKRTSKWIILNYPLQIAPIEKEIHLHNNLWNGYVLIQYCSVCARKT